MLNWLLLPAQNWHFMKISYSWLKNYLSIDLPAQKVGELLTDCGLEIEGIETVESVPGGLKGLVVGEVLTCETHPNADRLKLTTVNIGAEENLPVVCGAPNVAAGQKVIVATVGAKLYPEDGEPFAIKKSKIRGEVSMGMICAEDEIGLGQSHDGIMVLPAETQVGLPAAEHFNLQSDSVFEIGLTPNRADSMSHYGVARDLAAVLNRFDLPHGPLTLPAVNEYKQNNNDATISIEVKDSDACPRYVGICINNVTVKPSPEWLQNNLRSIGLSPINNIVDVTNFVLHELGQPLHAFDADKIEGNKVVVQQLNDKTKFTTLDETERELSDKDLMICNANEGMCIAGVFGGAKSGVSESTKNIFLESAYFNPVSVRKTAKRHGLNTDASFRFERGIDPEITVYAAKRAALLIQEVAGGQIASEIMEHYPNPINGWEIDFSFANCARLIGKEIPNDLIKKILNDLEIKIIEENQEGLKLYIPPFKVDVTREADVIEEVLRVYGYNHIENPSKMAISLVNDEKPNAEKIKNLALNFLANNGYNEMMANSLTKASYYENLDAAVEILNPLSQDLGIMRQSMLFSGLESIAYNQNRSTSDLKLFEFGKVYNQYGSGNAEQQQIALYLSGKSTAENWIAKSQASSIFELKGLVDGLFKKLGLSIEHSTSKESNNPNFKYGLQIKLQKMAIAEFGEVANTELKKLGIKNPVFCALINWDNVFALVKRNKTKYQEIPKFPSMRRDLALLVDKQTSFEALQQVALRSERNLLQSVNIFDVYQGKGLDPNKKSYALSFEFQDANKTLTDKVVDKAIKKIYDQLVKQTGAELRTGSL